MYISVGEAEYNDVIRAKLKGSGNVIFTGDSIPALGETPKKIETYRNDGFPLCTDTTEEYKRVVLTEGAIQLLKEELPEPVITPDESISPEDIEAAIREGANSV